MSATVANQLLTFNAATTVSNKLTVASGAAATIAQTVKGAASQSGDLTQWQDSSAGVLAKVDKAGVITAAKFAVSAMNTAPTSATDTGVLGEIRVTNGYIYVCVATDTWQRAAIASW